MDAAVATEDFARRIASQATQGDIRQLIDAIDWKAERAAVEDSEPIHFSRLVEALKLFQSLAAKTGVVAYFHDKLCEKLHVAQRTLYRIISALKARGFITEKWTLYHRTRQKQYEIKWLRIFKTSQPQTDPIKQLKARVTDGSNPQCDNRNAEKERKEQIIQDLKSSDETAVKAREAATQIIKSYNRRLAKDRENLTKVLIDMIRGEISESDIYDQIQASTGPQVENPFGCLIANLKRHCSYDFHQRHPSRK